MRNLGPHYVSMASHRNRLVRRCALNPQIPASRPPPRAAPRQGVAPPDPREGQPSPPCPERTTAAPLPICRPAKGAQPLDASGGGTMIDVAEGGTVAATCYPCPMLRHSVSRSRSTPTSPRRGARRTHPHEGHLRALLSRYFAAAGRNERHRRDHDAAGIAWRGHAPLVGVGNTQGRRPRRHTEGWAEVGGRVRPPWGGLCLSAVHLRREAEGIQ